MKFNRENIYLFASGISYYKLDRIGHDKFAFCELSNTKFWATGKFENGQAAIDDILERVSDKELLYEFKCLNDFIIFMAKEINPKIYSKDVNEYMNHLIKITNLLKDFGISIKQFADFVKAEQFKIEEISDLDYMKAKCYIWKEMIEDEKVSNNITQCLMDDEIPMVARYIMRNKLSLSELKWEEKQKWLSKWEIDPIFEEKWLAVADHILGWVQENVDYKD